MILNVVLRCDGCTIALAEQPLGKSKPQLVAYTEALAACKILAMNQGWVRRGEKWICAGCHAELEKEFYRAGSN